MSAAILTETVVQGLHYSETEGRSCSSASMEGLQDNTQMFKYGYSSSSSSSGVCEIEEEEEQQQQQHHEAMEAIKEEQEEGEDQNCVYVGVGKSETSMAALSWALRNLITNNDPSSTMVYLIHVFPEIKHIPNPLGMGMIPKNQVSAEQVESHMAQERGKRRELLHKFLQSCSASKVKVDTILIESDLVAKAILDLIPILNIRNLVIGTNKSNLRKSRSRKGNGIADQILQNAPESCGVRIISEGKEVNEQMMVLMSHSPHAPSPRANANDHTSMTIKEDHQSNSVSCICFKPMFK